jgi:hypothetical protein
MAEMELGRRYSSGRFTLKDDFEFDFNDISRASTPMSTMNPVKFPLPSFFLELICLPNDESALLFLFQVYFELILNLDGGTQVGDLP